MLHLSGPRLRAAFESLVEAAENTGGVERYVGALALKASLFEEMFGKGRVHELTETEFLDLAAFVTPARRRIGAWLAHNGYESLHPRLVKLLAGWSDVGTADQRMAAFCAGFPEDREHRWVRDLGAEVLHFTAPHHYPLMTRWMWDARVNTGVLREIWHDENGIPAGAIKVEDNFATFINAARGAGRLPCRQRRVPRPAVLRRYPLRSRLCRLHQRQGRRLSARAISAARRRKIPWRIRAGCSASTRSTPNPAARASS